MIRHFFTIALRVMQKRLTYLATSVIGLGIGLLCFVLVTQFAAYEKTHDAFFADAERIALVHTNVSPSAGFGTSRVYGAPPVLARFVEDSLAGVEVVSAYAVGSQSVRNEDTVFYESVKFVDSAFLSIFQFDYLSGGAEDALVDGSSVVVTAELALRYFGRTNIVGESLIIGGGETVRVAGVIRDLPMNSHFVYRFGTDTRLQILAPLVLLEKFGRDALVNEWSLITDEHRVYLKLTAGTDPALIGAGLDQVLLSNTSEDDRRLISGFGLTPLTQVNTMIWDLDGITVLDVLVAFATLILGVAVLNFSNIFAANIYRRNNEWGLRRTLGAGKSSILSQLIIESFLLAAAALAVAFMAAEFFLPLLGSALQKDLDLFAAIGTLDIALFILIVPLIAIIVAFRPALSIIRTGPRELLAREKTSGKKGARTRTALVIGQFVGGSFLAVVASISWVQNDHMVEMDLGLNPEGVVTVGGLSRPEVQQRASILRAALGADPAIKIVTAAEYVPFDQSFSTGRFDRTGGDGSSAFDLLRFGADDGFFETFEIPLVAGRPFDQTRADDAEGVDENGISQGGNVIINLMAVSTLGFESPEAAIGQSLFLINQDSPDVPYVIIGVVENSNFQAFTHATRATVFHRRPQQFSVLALRAVDVDMVAARAAVSRIWSELFPDLPLSSGVLTDVRDARIGVFRGVNMAVMALAAVALVITSLGLLGLVALYAEWRRKEVAMRKVLGASRRELQRFLSWQFMKPVFWSLLIGLPAGWLAAEAYLSLFADQTDLLGPVLLVVAVGVLLSSWALVAGHVYRLAAIHPAIALRSE